MSKSNVHPPKELPQNRRIESLETTEKDAKDLGYADSSGRAVNSPTRDLHQVGSSIVRRNEPDDQD